MCPFLNSNFVPTYTTTSTKSHTPKADAVPAEEKRRVSCTTRMIALARCYEVPLILSNEYDFGRDKYGRIFTFVFEVGGKGTMNIIPDFFLSTKGDFLYN